MALSEMDAFEALEALKKVKRDPEQVAAWSDMIHEFVRTQDLIARVNPPVDQIRQITEHLRAINQSAEQYEADELNRLWRVSRSDKQRGQALLPKFTQAHKDDDGVFSVHLRFGAFYLGANRVVHGGAPATSPIRAPPTSKPSSVPQHPSMWTSPCAGGSKKWTVVKFSCVANSCGTTPCVQPSKVCGSRSNPDTGKTSHR